MFPYINIFGHLIPTYGLLVFFGFTLATVICAIRAKRIYAVAYDYILVIAGMTLAMSIVFGRLLYVLVSYPWQYIIKSIIRLDFTIFSQGGLVFFGGLFGGIIGAFLAGKILKFDIMKIERIIVPLIPLGQAIGRIGCFLSGCCFGMEYNGPLAVRYINSVNGLSSEKTYFPIQLVASGADVLIMFYLLLYARQERNRGQVTIKYLIFYSCVRFILECFRGDTVRGVFNGLSTSQWISVFIFVLCIIIKILKKDKF